MPWNICILWKMPCLGRGRLATLDVLVFFSLPPGKSGEIIGVSYGFRVAICPMFLSPRPKR